MPKEEDAVLAVVDRFHRGMENSDVSAVGDATDRDKSLVWIGTGEIEFHTSWEAQMGWIESQLKESFREKKRQPTARYVRVHDDFAWVAERGSWRYVRSNGEVIETAYRYTFVLTKKKGKWRIVHGHASKGAPLPVYAFRVRLPFGLKQLDAALFGGLPEGSVVSLESPPLDERDALAKAFLQTGLRHASAGVLITRKYAQVAELNNEFPTRFFGVVCGPEADLAKEAFSNLALVKNFENLTELNLDLTRILDSIPEEARKTARCRLDILSDIMIRHGPVVTRKWFSELTSRLKARGFTTLVVFEPKMHEEKEQALLAELFEGRINCYEKTLQKKTNRFLRVVKMTDQTYHEDEIQLNKEDLKGIRQE